jgi:hypothetical protein
MAGITCQNSYIFDFLSETGFAGSREGFEEQCSRRVVCATKGQTYARLLHWSNAA